MNAPTLNELRNALPARELVTRDLAPRDLADEKMLQIRDLLLGDFIRETQARMTSMETRIRDLETGLGQRLSELHQRIETLNSDHTVDRRAAFDDLSKCVLELADRVRIIGR